MPSFLSRILLLLSVFGAAAGAAENAELLKTARCRVISADFVQTRRLAELDMEVRITGRMVSELDGRLRWQVDSPVRSVTVIDREKLTHYDGETKKLSVIRREAFPWLRILRDSLDDWLSGDKTRLARRFQVSSPRPRTVLLVPRESARRKLFRCVELEFSEKGDFITVIRIAESSGDKLEIRFSQLRRDPPLPRDLWRMPPR